jgi:CheY-like chemotaxis protein
MRRAQGEEEATSPAEFLSDSQILRGVRVLVAEDNSVNVFVVSQFLRKWGVDFDVVGNGRQALEQLQQHAYDLVLMDLQMPEVSGYEATRTLRALPDERLRRLPVLALTASARLGLEERVDLAGFTDYVGKPFKPDELFAKIAQYVSRPVAPGAPGSEQKADKPRDTEDPDRSPPRFHFEKFRAMAEGDPQALLELSTLALQNAEQCKPDFQQALEEGNSEAFEFHAHRMKMTLELMQTHALWAALQQGRALLVEDTWDEERIHAAVHAIHEELDALIAALREEVRTVSASLSPGNEDPPDPRPPRRS